ncbi:MAG: recombination regulator RecX [Nitrosomonadales bacterium]|nr:recombination regulator RecX [Nitrosomonadales bacterium]
MKHLARREYSRAELRAKLLPHAQLDEDLDALLDELAARNWLSDARVTELLVKQRRSRYGTQRIAHELRQKGIAENLIDEALPQLKETELESACEVWQKKFGVIPEDNKAKAKQMRFLQSRGFSTGVIFKVLQLAGSTELGEDC